ncbi:hypothetical protein [Sporosarcina psychrophila]|uniref:Uncharacterized protein n=1 Tax=Sporosarcina psychrophila TaxID=1476 RepID=A0ABV2KE74_SPOPS
MNNNYNKAEIQFSQPIEDTTVVPGDFTFYSGNGFNGSEFTTYRHNQSQTVDQVNDEYITIGFTPKTTVDQVHYTKGFLKGMNGLEVETQSTTPVLE